MSECRYCRAPILWARTENAGRYPLDVEPVDPATAPPRGLFVLRDRNSSEGPLALATSPTAFPDEPTFLSHFLTCPERKDR